MLIFPQLWGGGENVENRNKLFYIAGPNAFYSCFVKISIVEYSISKC